MLESKDVDFLNGRYDKSVSDNQAIVLSLDGACVVYPIDQSTGKLFGERLEYLKKVTDLHKLHVCHPDGIKQWVK